MVEARGTSGHPARRLAMLIAGAVMAFALIGIATFAAARLWAPSADPAERLPDSALFYADIRLSPGSDSTTMVARLFDWFGLDNSSADLEAGIADLLALVGADDVDPADVTRWIGFRGAIAIYDDVDSAGDDGTLTLAIASRDDRAARENLAAVLDASPAAFGYVVDDGLAVVTIAGRNPQARAEEIVAAGRAAPMADHEPFQSGLARLDGDYFATAWIDARADVSTAIDPGPIVVGVQVIDDGLEAHFVAGTTDGVSGGSDWLDRLGDVGSAEMAVVATLPDDLGEPNERLIEFVDGIYNSPLPLLDQYERGLWDYDLALSEAELDEYNDLNRRWGMGTLSEDDPDFDRLIELDDTYWTFGLQSDYDDAAAKGWLDSYFAVRAVSHDEYYELLRIESQWGTPAVSDVDEEWYYKASRRLYAYGLESDYPWYEPEVDANDVAGQLLDYLSGITITATANDVLGDVDLGLAAEVANGRADRLYRLPRRVLHDLFEVLEADPRFDDTRVVFRELEGVDGTLSDHPDFADAFDGMPAEAVVAMFVDLRAIAAAAPDLEDGRDDFSVLSLVYGTDGAGVIRLLEGVAPTGDAIASRR